MQQRQAYLPRRKAQTDYTYERPDTRRGTARRPRRRALATSRGFGTHHRAIPGGSRAEWPAQSGAVALKGGARLPAGRAQRITHGCHRNLRARLSMRSYARPVVDAAYADALGIPGRGAPCLRRSRCARSGPRVAVWSRTRGLGISCRRMRGEGLESAQQSGGTLERLLPP